MNSRSLQRRLGPDRPFNLSDGHCVCDYVLRRTAVSVHCKPSVDHRRKNLKLIACCLLLLQFANCLAQVPTKAEFEKLECKFIATPNSEDDLTGCDFMIYCVDREAAVEILSKFHLSDKLEYEVEWGSIDVVRVWESLINRVQQPDYRSVLRSVLKELTMTYRIDGGVVQLLYRGPGAFVIDYSFDPPQVEIDGGAVTVLANKANSLDYLAAVLSQRGIGYHVNQAKGQEIELQARRRSLRYVLDQIDALDDGLEINWINGVSVAQQSNLPKK